MDFYTREQIRQLDRRAIEEYAIPGMLLMENAGRVVAERAAEMVSGIENKFVAVFCGKGNNGGDGYVAARHLYNWGCDVRVYLVPPVHDVLEAGGDAAVNLNIILKMKIPVVEIDHDIPLDGSLKEVREAALIIDALLGTGISGKVRGSLRPLIAHLNSLTAPKLAVDIPSGMDCDTGEALGTAVVCTHTVTFAVAKKGFASAQASLYTGGVEVAYISIPRQLIQSLP